MARELWQLYSAQELWQPRSAEFWQLFFSRKVACGHSANTLFFRVGGFVSLLLTEVFVVIGVYSSHFQDGPSACSPLKYYRVKFLGPGGRVGWGRDAHLSVCAYAHCCKVLPCLMLPARAQPQGSRSCFQRPESRSLASAAMSAPSRLMFGPRTPSGHFQPKISPQLHVQPQISLQSPNSPPEL